MLSKTSLQLLELQEYLDSVKKSIPECIYLEFCDKLRKTYLECKQREREILENMNDCIGMVEIEKDLQEESNNDETWNYLHMSYKIEADLKALQSHMEYKLLKKNEYNEYNYVEMLEKFTNMKKDLS